jgi:HipA-like protein
MRKAEVFLYDRPVGILEELDHGYRFSYRAEYLNDPKAAPVSLCLPLRPEPFEDKRMFPFFDGLIPEGCSSMAGSVLRTSKIAITNCWRIVGSAWRNTGHEDRRARGPGVDAAHEEPKRPTPEIKRRRRHIVP